jgi:hypothetical protein
MVSINDVERKKWVKKAFGMSKSGGKNSIKKSPCSSGLMNISTGKISAPYEKPYMTRKERAMPVGNPPM